MLAVLGGVIGSLWAYAPLSLIGGVLAALIFCLLALLVLGLGKLIARGFSAPVGLIALVGGALGSVAGFIFSSHVIPYDGFAAALKVHFGGMAVAWAAAAVMGLFSALIPSYHASRLGIVEGLRHIG
jgi:ABC-type lipoprotein release transport system permease subunit